MIESDEYGKSVFHAVDVNMDDQDFSMMDEVIYASWKKITSQIIHLWSMWILCQILGHLKMHELNQQEGVKSFCNQCSGYQ